MGSLAEILERLRRGGEVEADEIAALLPGRNSGLCGFRTCADLARAAVTNPELIQRCVFLEEYTLKPPEPNYGAGRATWHDLLGREFDFVLDKLADDPGPREHILLGNPANLERLRIAKGDVLCGRPALGVGCPVTHCGVVVQEPDYFNGAVVWCVVGPISGRERGIDIGYYQIIAYEGLVRETQGELGFGERHYFLPRYCMLQSRHSGLINAIYKTANGYHVRLEGIWLG
jgi:uncharacterized Fe-S cluster-containing protein